MPMYEPLYFSILVTKQAVSGSVLSMACTSKFTSVNSNIEL